MSEAIEPLSLPILIYGHRKNHNQMVHQHFKDLIMSNGSVGVHRQNVGNDFHRKELYSIISICSDLEDIEFDGCLHIRAKVGEISNIHD
jgi:hypothetical protein